MTQPQPAYSGLDLGAGESQASNRIYVSLRTGKICRHNKEQLPGYAPKQTTNPDGSINNFYAKEYDHLTGFVTDVRWHTNKRPDGKVLSSWNVTVDTTKEVYVLQIAPTDRPFNRFMNTMLAVDFTKPVRFVAFTGRDKQKNLPQKVLLITQETDSATGKPKWIQPVHEEKWLSRLVINKLKQGVPLTEAEERNVSRNTDGSFNKNFPYITQGLDEKWSFDAWKEFLHEQMQEFVIPAVKAAAEARGEIVHPDNRGDAWEPPLEDDNTAFSGPAPSPVSDDDIPF